MAETNLYIVRHGKTMFNTIGRAQGWSDTPLTAKGERGIRELGVGLKESGLVFKEAFSSDSGRTLQTMEIILNELGQTDIPYTRDKRIREWCFGSLDGAYDAELFDGVLPRIFGDRPLATLSREDMANAILEADTAGWAEPWPILRDRIWEGFTVIAEKIAAQGGGNALVVSHGMTIATFAGLIDPTLPRSLGLDNGSVCLVRYADGQFTVEVTGDMSYRVRGAEVLDGRQ